MHFFVVKKYSTIDKVMNNELAVKQLAHSLNSSPYHLVKMFDLTHLDLNVAHYIFKRIFFCV